MRLIVFVVCAGCWAANDRPPPIAPAPLANTAPSYARPAGVRRSVWAGQYTCTQGVTALRLSLERDGDRVDATFEFGPLDVNPQVPHGVYRMSGTATRDADGLTLQLSPTEWVEQPQGYVMVGLHATSTDGRMLRGRIDHPGCRDVEVTRVD